MKKTFGILAHPAGHSLSPIMHKAGFEALNLPYEFEAWDVSSEDLKDFINGLQPPVEGFSVSMPHKQTIIPLLDELDSAGEAVKAVSCVYYRDGKYIGTNLDYMGVKGSVQASQFAKNNNLKGEEVIVLGAGGAAKAAVYGLLELGMKPTLYNRTFEKAEEVAAQFGIEAHHLEEMITHAKNARIVVNCTSLGLKHDQRIVPDEVFEHIELALDAVYSAHPTTFQIQAESYGNNQKGAELLTGLDWLLHQGYEAFRLWTGQDAPKEVMRNVLKPYKPELR